MKSSQKCSTIRNYGQTKSFVLNTLDSSIEAVKMKKSPSDNKLVQPQKAYIMIQPKLVEFMDEHNMKKTKLQFENSITKLKTLDVIDLTKPEEKDMKIITDRSAKRKESLKQSLKAITQL